MPQIAQVMTPFPHAVDADAQLEDARASMLELGIRHLPVTRGEELVGVLTERDTRLVLGSLMSDAPTAKLRVKDACQLDAYVVDPHAPVDVVLREMAGRHIGSALVVKGGRLAGIFTVTDACRVLGDLLRQLFPGSGDDAA